MIRNQKLRGSFICLPFDESILTRLYLCEAFKISLYIPVLKQTNKFMRTIKILLQTALISVQHNRINALVHHRNIAKPRSFEPMIF